MSPFQAVREGARAVNRARRVWLVYYLFTLAFAAVAVLPAAALLSRNLGRSLHADRMLAGIDPHWAVEFAQSLSGPAAALMPLALAGFAAWVLVNTFLAGGAISIFASPEAPYRPGAFWQGCGKNFGRLFRLLLLSLVCYALVLAAGGGGVRRIAEAIWGEGLQERPLVLFGWFRAALVLALALLINLVFDYARIRLVVEDSHKTLHALLESVRLVFRNFRLSAGNYALVGVLALALTGLYAAVSKPLPRDDFAWLVLLFALQQAFVAGRTGVKLLFYASQTGIYRSLIRTAPDPVPLPQPVPAKASTLGGPEDELQ